MPLISAPNETRKDRLIRNLRQLPDDLLKKAYHVELISKRALCQHDLYLEDKYQDFKLPEKSGVSGDVFTYYRIGEWDVSFEVED